MGILFIYAVTIVVYTFKPWSLELLLSPLPFVTFAGDFLILLPIFDTAFPMLCSQILSLVILSFLVNLTDSFMPKGKTVPGWYMLRFLTVILCMGLHLGVSWAFRTFLPENAPAHLKKWDNKGLGLLCFAVCLCLLVLLDDYREMQAFCLLSLPFLGLYSGKRGKWRMKYFFYIFYPVHLAVLEGLAMLLK
jgi:hypothetical protein